jgi:hypothetical protein
VETEETVHDLSITVEADCVVCEVQEFTFCKWYTFMHSIIVSVW